MNKSILDNVILFDDAYKMYCASYRNQEVRNINSKIKEIDKIKKQLISQRNRIASMDFDSNNRLSVLYV